VSLVRLFVFPNGWGYYHSGPDDESDAVAGDRQHRGFTDCTDGEALHFPAIAIEGGVRIESVPQQLSAQFQNWKVALDRDGAANGTVAADQFDADGAAVLLPGFSRCR
jgi:hypothetical protein